MTSKIVHFDKIIVLFVLGAIFYFEIVKFG